MNLKNKTVGQMHEMMTRPQETGFILISQMMVSIEFLMSVFVLKIMATELLKLLKATLQELLKVINATAECAY